jgi:hypothetical protein
VQFREGKTLKILWPPTGGGGGEGLEERTRLPRTLLYQEYTTRVAQIPGLNIIDHSTSLADFSAPRNGAKTGNERKPSETHAPLTRPTALAGKDPLTRPTASVSSEPVARPNALTANGPLFREQVGRLFVHQNLTKLFIFFQLQSLFLLMFFYFAGKKKLVIESVAP